MRANKRHVQLLPKYPAGTMPGFGWLREAPRPLYGTPPAANLAPEEIARHAALRKCIYFPMMPVATPNAHRAAERIASEPEAFRPKLRRRSPEGLRSLQEAQSERAARRVPKSRYDDPVSVGILLAVLPPVGFMMLWGSSRYSRDAKLAITALMSVFMLLATAAICTAIVVTR